MDIQPAYTIHKYRDDIYKVVAFKRALCDSGIRLCREQQHNDSKLLNNLSRARSMVLQYALCNPWDYFFTGTLDRAKMDRYDLDAYAMKLSQFIRDKRKAYGASLQVLLVPERHKDGAWHMHGMVRGLPEDKLAAFVPPAPQHLIDGGFLDWPDYREKFGFCSLGFIRDPVASAFYITKYIGKDLSHRGQELGKHLYFHSRPLCKAERASDVYLYNPALDSLCTQDFPWCKTGMVEDEDWTFPLRWDGLDVEQWPDVPPAPRRMTDPLADFDPRSIDPLYEQTVIADF